MRSRSGNPARLASVGMFDPPDGAETGPETVGDVLGPSQLIDVLHRYGEALDARRKQIDRLNVYPVPDGDTGTNMALTVQSVLAELRNATQNDMRSVATAISRGAIMGARGNSGAILAQVLRGIAESIKDKASLRTEDLADALERARTSAYESVLKPVEGTILTVVTAAAHAAREHAHSHSHLPARLGEQVEHVRRASSDALARTPELLPVLKQAGVVDAGGSGFLLLIDALRYVITGEAIPGAVDDADEVQAPSQSTMDAPDVMHMAHTELSDLRYEVMFLLEGDDARIPDFRQSWAAVGDSIVVVGGDGIWNCHIHTDAIGEAIETALDFGRPRQIRVCDLQEQAASQHPDAWINGDVATTATSETESVSTAVVAVVNGQGMARIFLSFGVQRIVTGGQSMNPSVSELLAAVESAPSPDVIVLPNNKNIHAAAQQLGSLSTKRVEVIPTRSVVEGLAALVPYDAAVDVETNVRSMSDAAGHVVCAEVTQAVRDMDDEVRPIKKGDWLGVVTDGIAVVSGSLQDALCQVVDTLAGDDHEIITLIEGEDASDEVTKSLAEWLKEHRPAIEMEIHHGGQPLYPYLVGIE